MKNNIIKNIFTVSLFIGCLLHAEDGYRLWLRYDKISNPQVLKAYTQSIKGFLVEGKSATVDAAREELQMGLTFCFRDCRSRKHRNG